MDVRNAVSIGCQPAGNDSAASLQELTASHAYAESCAYECERVAKGLTVNCPHADGCGCVGGLVEHVRRARWRVGWVREAGRREVRVGGPWVK